MTPFLRAQIFLRLLPAYALLNSFAETRTGYISHPFESKFVKNVGDREYAVKTMFSTFTPSSSSTQKPDLDEIDYYDGTEFDGGFRPFCSDIEFECLSDHKCIPIERYCDRKNDCADESDETTCAIETLFKTLPSPNNSLTIILLIVIIFLLIGQKMYEGSKFLYTRVAQR